MAKRLNDGVEPVKAPPGTGRGGSRPKPPKAVAPRASLDAMRPVPDHEKTERCSTAKTVAFSGELRVHPRAEPGFLLAPLQAFGEQHLADPAALHANVPAANALRFGELAQVGHEAVQRPGRERQIQIGWPAQGGGDDGTAFLGRVGRRTLRAHVLFQSGRPRVLKRLSQKRAVAPHRPILAATSGAPRPSTTARCTISARRTSPAPSVRDRAMRAKPCTSSSLNARTWMVTAMLPSRTAAWPNAPYQQKSQPTRRMHHLLLIFNVTCDIAEVWLPFRLFGAGGDDGCTWLGDPSQIALAISLKRHRRGGAAAVCAGRGGPARGVARAGHRASLGRCEPGGCGPGRGTRRNAKRLRLGAPVAARCGAALQRRGPGRAARPPAAGTAGAADRGAAGRAAGLGAGGAGPGGGRDQQLPPARHRRAHRAALGGVLHVVRPVPDAAPHGPVMADDAACPSQGGCGGAGAI